MAQSLTQNVYETILEKLLKHEIYPGSLLDRKELAKELGVSVGTVLLALNQLEMEGFLETLPRKGTLVRPITYDEAYGQFLLREALECMGARLYCGEKIIEHEEELTRLAEEIDASIPYKPDNIHLDLQFHNMLIELTGIQTYIRQYKKVLQLNFYHTLHKFTLQPESLIIDSHVDLVQKLKTTDKAEAEEAIRQHLRKGRIP